MDSRAPIPASLIGHWRVAMKNLERSNAGSESDQVRLSGERRDGGGQVRAKSRRSRELVDEGVRRVPRQKQPMALCTGADTLTDLRRD